MSRFQVLWKIRTSLTKSGTVESISKFILQFFTDYFPILMMPRSRYHCRLLRTSVKNIFNKNHSEEDRNFLKYNSRYVLKDKKLH